MLFVGINRIMGGITVLEIYSQRVLSDRFNIAYVTLATQHVVITAKKLPDGVRFVGGLNYNQIFAHTRI